MFFYIAIFLLIVIFGLLNEYLTKNVENVKNSNIIKNVKLREVTDAQNEAAIAHAKASKLYEEYIKLLSESK